MLNSIESYEKDGGFKRVAIGSFVLVLGLLALYILQWTGVIPMSPF